MSTDRERFDQFVLKAQRTFDIGYAKGVQALQDGSPKDPDVEFPLYIKALRNDVLDGLPMTYELQEFEDKGRLAALATARKTHPATLRHPPFEGDFRTKTYTWYIDYLVQF